MIERIQTAPSLPELYNALTEHEPKLIAKYVPMDGPEQKEAFLSGEIENPDHTYDRLAAVDFTVEQAVIDDIGAEILAHADLNPKYAEVYRQFIATYKRKLRLMELARQIKTLDDPAAIAVAEQEYMTLNSELYGEPDEAAYRSLLQEKTSKIAAKQLDGEAASLRDELFELIDQPLSHERVARFKPADETVAWIHEATQVLYSGMLARVPEQESFTPTEVRHVFEDIIRAEFGESAEDWTVDIESAQSINVKSTEKRIVIPEDRKDMNRETLRQLVVHEIGVHMLRAVMGGQTDLAPLRNGLDEYYDSEEGLGKVMEQALAGEFKEAGIDHYITAGLAYYDQKDFRGAFEVKWRLAVLEKLKDGAQPTEEATVKAKDVAYKQTMRSMRGTDRLPWFKDLAYYNGPTGMWRHLEEIRGDDLKFTFVLLGKADPANRTHERVMYETKEA